VNFAPHCHLHSSPDIIWVIKSREIRLAGMRQVWGGGYVHTGFWWKNLREEDDLEDLGTDGSLILRKIDLQELEQGGMYGIVLAQNSEKWRGFVKRKYCFAP
jgi:hypothetical protein